jgi:two-component system LytT family sensor kinase
MDENPSKPDQNSAWLYPPARLWIVSLVFYSFAAGAAILQSLASLAPVGRPVSVRYLVGASLTGFIAYGALAPLVLWSTWRFPIERKNWFRRLCLHLLFSLVFAIALVLIRPYVWEIRNRMTGSLMHPSWQLYRNLFLWGAFDNIFNTYWPLVGLGHAMLFARRAKERALRASRLETWLAEAHLAMLKMQLQPHFLFNTLHAITALIRSNAAAAEEMLVRLSDLLRITLEQQTRQELPLKEEVDFIGQYLAVEQVRFADRLSIQMDLAPDTLDALVPNMVLQPLVENALRHGIARQASGGRITLLSRREGQSLCLCVQNDGPGLPPASVSNGPGLGLANTRSRLQQLYGNAASLSLENRGAGGVEACIRVPFRNAGSAPESPQVEPTETAASFA